MQLIEVTDKKTKKDFLDVARIIYKDDSTWVCPLDIEINNIFDPRENTFYTHGDACRWILRDNTGNLIGRVAAFINQKKAHTFDQPTGGMGFLSALTTKRPPLSSLNKLKHGLTKEKWKLWMAP